MATMQSRLLVSLIDGVTAPAGKVSKSLLGIPGAARRANGQMMTFGDRMKVAIERNNASLDAARGRMVDAVAGAYVLKRGFDATAGAAMSLEEKMADIAKVSDMSDSELRSFEKVLRNLARNEIPLAVEELADLAAAASQSGIANDDLEAFTEMVARTAVAWDVSGQTAGESLAKLKTALGLTIEETEAYGDAINYLSDTTASSAPELIEFARRVAADGKVAGFANEEVLALGATMISMGAQSEVAATSLRNVGRMLSRGDFGATKKQRQAFAELGLSVEKVSKGMQIDASGTLLAVLEEVSKADAAKRLALMSGIFGDEARALMPLLSELDRTREAIAGVADETNYLGSVQKEFEVRSKTGRYALQRMRNQFRDIAIVLGQSLIPGMKAAIDAMGPYLLAVANLIERHPKLVATLATVAAGVVGLRIALTGLSYVAFMGRGGALSAIAGGAKVLGGTVGHLWGAARASMALQAALGAMSGQSIGALGKVAAGARGMLLAIPGVSGLAGALKGLGAALGIVSAPIWVFAAAAAAIAAVGFTIWKYWDRIASIMTGVGQAVGELLAPAFEKARPVLEWFAPLGDLIAAGWGKAKDAIAAVSEWLGAFFGKEKLSDSDKEQFRQAGYDAIMALWDGMKQVASDLLDWVGGLAGKILAPFRQLKDTIAGWGWGDGAAAEAAGAAYLRNNPGMNPYGGARASGGPVTAGRSYLVGEEGPEIITPDKGGYVHPNGAIPGGAGAGGPSQITITNHVTISGVADAKAAAAEAIRQIEQRTQQMLRGAYAT